MLLYCDRVFNLGNLIASLRHKITDSQSLKSGGGGLVQMGLH